MSEKTLKSGAPACPDRFVSPDCPHCGSDKTFVQKTEQLEPFTAHHCKCRNCGRIEKVISRVVGGCRVIL